MPILRVSASTSSIFTAVSCPLPALAPIGAQRPAMVLAASRRTSSAAAGLASSGCPSSALMSLLEIMVRLPIALGASSSGAGAGGGSGAAAGGGGGAEGGAVSLQAEIERMETVKSAASLLLIHFPLVKPFKLRRIGSS